MNIGNTSKQMVIGKNYKNNHMQKLVKTESWLLLIEWMNEWMNESSFHNSKLQNQLLKVSVKFWKYIFCSLLILGYC